MMVPRLTSLTSIASLAAPIAVCSALRVAILGPGHGAIGDGRWRPLHGRHHDWSRERSVACSHIRHPYRLRVGCTPDDRLPT
jgi:hypothetical protein